MSPINPRAVIHTPSGKRGDSEPGFVVVAFTRGEQFVEILSHDGVRDEVHFFLLRYQTGCSELGTCSPVDRFTVATERDWVGWSLYGEDDLKNTTLDCLQCHEQGYRDSEASHRKSPLMFEQNSFWRHWLYTNSHYPGWEDNPVSDGGPYMEMLFDFVDAYATSAEPSGGMFAGIPGGSARASRPMALEVLLEGNGVGNGFDHTLYDSVGRGLGMFDGMSWDALYGLNLSGRLIQVPSPRLDPTDSERRMELIAAFSAFRNGNSSTLPDPTIGIFPEERLHEVGLRLMPGLSAPEMLVQACTQCHHDQLDQTISRANFNLRLGELSEEVIREAITRVNLPADHLLAMPPARLRTLTCDERTKITTYLNAVLEGRKTEEDGAPNRAVFAERPQAFDHTSVSMRAEPRTDASHVVEYKFEEVSGQPGGNGSGWQLSPYFVDAGLQPLETYEYRVRVRDGRGNEGEASEVLAVTTGASPSTCIDVVLPDADCDGVRDPDERTGDTDGDGIPDKYDVDDDNDGMNTITEVLEAQVYGDDVDRDGVPNWLDTDSDADGTSDSEEGAGDFDLDGIPNYLDNED